MTDLAIDGKRLWRTIDETARFGGTRGGGVTRLALTLTLTARCGTGLPGSARQLAAR